MPWTDILHNILPNKHMQCVILDKLMPKECSLSTLPVEKSQGSLLKFQQTKEAK